MWIIIVIAVRIVSLMIALLIAYLDLRSKVENMKDTIDFQNERYMACLEGWSKSIKLLNKVISLNGQLLDELNSVKED